MQRSRTLCAMIAAATAIWSSPCAAGLARPQADRSAPEGAQARDFRSVLARFDEVVAQMIFDPRILRSAEWRAFRADFGAGGLEARSDEAFVAAFDSALARNPLFSHFELRLQNGSVADMRREADRRAASNAVARFEANGDGVGIIRIRSFFGDTIQDQIDRTFDDAIAARVHSLIIDLRGNPGGTFAAWPVLARLTPRRIPVGYLVAGLWYATHESPPGDADLAAAIPLTVPDAAALGADLMADGLLVLAVEPQRPRFEGRVIVLIDQETASTSEIVAAALQHNRLATIIGTRSAGEVLNADQIPLANGISLLLPLADFMLPDGRRLEGTGIVPDLTTESDSMACALAAIGGARSCPARLGERGRPG